jgi:hypothetical protein
VSAMTEHEAEHGVGGGEAGAVRRRRAAKLWSRRPRYLLSICSLPSA